MAPCEHLANFTMTAYPLTIQQEVSDLSFHGQRTGHGNKRNDTLHAGGHGTPSSGLLCAGSQLDGKGRTTVAEIWRTQFLLPLMIKCCEGNKQDGK